MDRYSESAVPRRIDHGTLIRLNDARDYIAHHFDQSLSLEALAEIACFSPYHFLRQYKRVFQETPHQFLTRRRLERAEALLRQDNLTVSEICLEVGYESLGSFSAMFAKHAGCPPTDFRRIYSVPTQWFLRNVPGCFVSRSNILSK